MKESLKNPPYILQQQKGLLEILLDDLKSNIKEIGLVTVLYLLLSLPQFNELIVKYIPQLTTENNINMVGLTIKAVLSGILFFIVKKFIFN